MRWILLLALAAPAAAEWKQKAPGPRVKGKVFQWTARNGGLYLYWVPKNYDHKEGANLTFILHGSNGAGGWGMANITPANFRPDDIIVSPDGTTSNGRKGFNRAPTPKDAEYLHTLHTELKETFNIRATFLYGHSQGSYFAHYYAAEYPDEVDGYVAMASGLWNNPKRGEGNHRQAIVVLHGTQDPVVPYGAGVYAYTTLKKEGFPKLHFRSLEGWNHWPTNNNSKAKHTAQQLAWCEGMTTRDLRRLKIAFDYLLAPKQKERHDYAAVYTLALRITKLEEAPAGQKSRAEKAMKGVDAGARAHIAALKAARDGPFEGKPWIGHLPMFLRAYRDVPAREELAKQWDPILEKHAKAAIPHLRTFYAKRDINDVRSALDAGAAAIRDGYLHYECADLEFRKTLRNWRKDAKKLGITRDSIKAYDAVVPAYEKALDQAYRGFESANRKVKP